MRLRVQLPRRRYALATAVACSAMLAAKPVFAQDNGDNKNDQTTDAAKSSTADAASESTQEAAPESTTQEQATETTTEPEAQSTTTKEEDPTTTTEQESTSTTEQQSDTTTEASNTDSTTDLSGGGITGGPTLTRGFGIPEYPAATVPPTSHAPFMHHSKAPDGTVFIIVGAVLGALGLGLLLWRMIVGLLLHRSVERAALAQHDANSKAGFPAPPAPFYKYTDQGSNMSVSGGIGGGAAAAGRGVRRTNRGPTPSANPSHSNLFFSPTAAGTGTGGNRSSTFLPSGFYAAGGNAGGANHTQSISLTNLRPDSRGHGAGRNLPGPSPPDSPSFAARRDISGSSLGHVSGQRAPSAYLDDLLADDPSALPPPHMPPSTGPRHSNLGPGSNRF